jgi:raffinose/stachyose/melibiose transport system permease protein
MNNKWVKLWIALFLAPTIIILCFFYIIPIITVLYTGFTDWNGLTRTLLPRVNFVGFDNYIKLFTYDDTFIKALRNTILWSLIAATLHVGYGTLVAFVLYKKRIGWRFTRAAFMIPNLISVAAWAMMYKMLFNDDMGIINNFIRNIGFSDFHLNWFFESPAAFFAVALTWLFYAVYVTLIVFNELMAIPREVYEASLLDGASNWQVTRFINIPLVKNAIATGIILSVTSRINGIAEVALTSRGGPGNDTYNIVLMLQEGITNSQYGYANAAATVMILLGIFVLVAINKLFRMDEKTY